MATSCHSLKSATAKYVAIFLAAILLGQLGCTSMSSTMLTRDESNQFWTRKGGLKGVPITLKVPTQVKLTVFERHYLWKPDKDKASQRVRLPFVVRDFAQEFIYTEKVFTVDFKRPGAGNYNLHLDLTPDQYIQQIQHDVTDNTISEVASLVDQLLPEGGLQPKLASKLTQDLGDGVKLEKVESVVAVGIFEIDEPDFEQQMTNFVNCHLNQAHDAWVAQPDVSFVHRTQLSGFTQPSDVCGGIVQPYGEPHACPDVNVDARNGNLGGHDKYRVNGSPPQSTHPVR